MLLIPRLVFLATGRIKDQLLASRTRADQLIFVVVVVVVNGRYTEWEPSMSVAVDFLSEERLRAVC